MMESATSIMIDWERDRSAACGHVVAAGKQEHRRVVVRKGKEGGRT